MKSPLNSVTLLGESPRRARGRDHALTDGAAALSTLGIGLASLDSDLRYLEINEWLASAQGLSPAQHQGRPLHEIVPHLARELEPILRRVLSTGHSAIDLPIRETGIGVQAARHWLVRCYPIREEPGEVTGVNCVMEEITDRVRAQEALAASEAALRHSHARTRSLAGRLITAQETERTRIARELHDDMSQRLATLAIGLSSLKRELPPTCAHLGDELQQCQDWAVELADEIRNLSHELHPGVLRHAGLVAALKSICGEVERKRGLAVSFEAPDHLEEVPAEIALCLYRVAQETLHNAATHARARHVLVSLVARDGELELSVRDDGCGFDLGAARRKGGLGLLSIDERVRLVGGVVALTSAPGRGTTVSARIPFAARTAS
ncbi:MAG TPA: PAS domain-containing protein [Gemmatimonadales bacterium]